MSSRGKATRSRGRNESERVSEGERMEYVEARGLDLIDKVDFYRRGTIYLRHVAAFTFAPCSFFAFSPSPRSSCPGPFVSSTTRHYPRRNARRVHHVLSFTCLASRFRIIFSFASDFPFMRYV